jgi:hypothetical protein
MDRNRFLDADDIVFVTNATSRRADRVTPARM